jgi:hypothetical protein
LNRCFKPTPEINHPPTLLEKRLWSLEQDMMIARTEKSLEVKVQYPVPFPATLPT